MTKSETIRRARLISGSCSVLSGALALFWLIETLVAQVPMDRYVFATIFYFTLIALSFVLFLRGRNIVVASWWPFLAIAAGLAMEQKDRFSVPAVTSLAAAVGFIVTMTILQRQRRRAAQPGVEPAGPSARGLTP